MNGTIVGITIFIMAVVSWWLSLPTVTVAVAVVIVSVKSTAISQPDVE